MFLCFNSAPIHMSSSLLVLSISLHLFKESSCRTIGVTNPFSSQKTGYGKAHWLRGREDGVLLSSLQGSQYPFPVQAGSDGPIYSRCFGQSGLSFLVSRAHCAAREGRACESIPIYRISTNAQFLWPSLFILFILSNGALFQRLGQPPKLYAQGANLCVLLVQLLD